MQAEIPQNTDGYLSFDFSSIPEKSIVIKQSSLFSKMRSCKMYYMVKTGVAKMFRIGSTFL